MGYNTYHQFDIEGDDPSGLTEDDHTQALGVLSEYNEYLFEDSIKWYDQETDMLEYSLRYPETIFKITGDGEEQGDEWIAYYLNGKSQTLRPTVTWPQCNINNFS